jgi:hypothetical protein
MLTICSYRPKTKEELFNLRHSSARNVVERIFGVLKGRFRILSLAPQYSLQIQARIPAALSALHNFIRIHTRYDEAADEDDLEDDADAGDDQDSGGDNFNLANNFNDDESAKAWRDDIANAMWIDYQEVLRTRVADDDAMDVDDGDGNMDDDEDCEYESSSNDSE